MATASVPNGNFVNGTPADADEVDANFAALVSFLNNSVVHRDGTKAMTAAFDGGGFKVSNVATATAASDAPRLDQVAVSNYEVTSGGTACATSPGTMLDTISVTVPTAGLALIMVTGSMTTAGVTYGGFGTVSVDISASGSLTGTPVLSVVNGSDTTTGFSGLIYVSLSAGANTITLTGTKVYIGGASGGTATIDTGFKSAIVGMF